MKNEKTTGSIAIARINDALKPLAGSIIPIFRAGSGSRPEAFGSAVLVELAGQRFLLTARHVVDEHLKSPIYVAGTSGFVAIEGEFFCTPEAGHDVATLRLDGDLASELGQHPYLSEADILPADHYDGCNHLTLIGYPASRARDNRQAKRVRTQCYSIGVRVLSLAGTTLRGAFRRKRHRDGKSLLKVTAPDPHGMSGGAMFASNVASGNAGENYGTKLAGLSTTWLEDQNEVAGTKIAVVLAMIRDAYGVAIPDALAPARLTLTIEPPKPDDGVSAAAEA